MTANRAFATSPSPVLVIVTNNRFWRERIGSNARIASLHRHLQAQGWTVLVAFGGRSYAEDKVPIESLGTKVHFSQPNPAVEAIAGGQPVLASRPDWVQGIGARARTAQRWLRAVASQLRRARPPGGWAGLWREVALRAREPRVTDFVDERLALLIEQLAKRHQPEAILVEYVLYAWVAHQLRGRLSPQIAWLLDTHDVMHERQQRFHAVGEAHSLDITAEEEAGWMQHFDAVLAIQDRDAEKLRAMAGTARVITVLHPHPALAMPALGHGPIGIGFIGSSMAPNRLALEELIQRIWPRVLRETGSKAALVVAGGVCEALETLQLPPHVEVLGYLDDLDDFYRRVDVVVSPLRIGGGLKIKNVEALCKGKALVTTTIGAEGMEAAAGQAFLVADDAEQIAQLLVRLVHSVEERQSLACKALEFARCTFSEEAAYRELDGFVESRRAATAAAPC